MGEEKIFEFCTLLCALSVTHSNGVLFSYQIMPRTLFVWGFFRGVILISNQEFMNLAFKEAQKGVGQTWTNPLVGAVIVKDHQILAKGYHHRFGARHAEIDALNQLPKIELARGATIYVTLEPCSHFGKTPPCANRLVELGIRRVVIGQMDPNPLVAGKGVKILRDAGVEVEILNQTGGINDKYNFYYQNKRPFLTVKYAMTLDGKINQNSVTRSIISGRESYYDVQKLRSQNQAILVGENTLKIDDPMLTVRENQVAVPPLRVVLVNDADKIDLKSAIFKDPANILILSRKPTSQTWPENVEIVENQAWSPATIVDQLAKRGIQSVLIEGGSHVHAMFMASKLVDEIDVYIATIIYGGNGLPAIFGEVKGELPDYKLYSKVDLGHDIKFTLRRK